jgi:hypothetical protein
LLPNRELTSLGFTFALGSHHERRELVAVCRTLLCLGVLQRVAGDEDAFVQGGGDQADALYDVHRPALAGILAAVRGPSTWPAEEAPGTLDQRLHTLLDEHVADSDEGQRTALRHRIARRLLDDPAVYLEDLNPDTRSLATDDRQQTDTAGRRQPFVKREHDIVDFLRDAKSRYGRYWRKSAREPGAERELAKIAIGRLEKLQLIVRNADSILPLPALARFALGEAEIRQDTPAMPIPASDSLFSR